MNTAMFSVPIRDLERDDQRRRWDLTPEWVNRALDESEARSDGSVGVLELYLKKSGREVLVKGEATVNVTMPCARTLDPVPIRLVAPIMLLLTPKAPSASTPGRSRRRDAPRARTAADDEADEQLSAEQAARDEYDGDAVVLDAFVREHLLLELPLFPVRSDLPLEPPPATDAPPDEPGDAVDPRLAPLAALASQLQRNSKE